MDGKLVHAVRRRGSRVTGDGTSTIEQLIGARNAELTAAGARAISIDRNALFTLAYQGLDRNTIPRTGQECVLKTIPEEDDSFTELRTVYDQTVTDLICSEVKATAEAAVRVIDSEFAGVDIITMDPTRPLEQVSGAINEVNTTPALHHHYDVRKEKYPSVAPAVLATLLGRR
jgi:cyanophycin synthetase